MTGDKLFQEFLDILEPEASALYRSDLDMRLFLDSVYSFAFKAGTEAASEESKEDLQERIDQLESEIEDLESDKEDLQQDVRSLETELDIVRKDYDDLWEKLENLLEQQSNVSTSD